MKKNVSVGTTSLRQQHTVGGLDGRIREGAAIGGRHWRPVGRAASPRNASTGMSQSRKGAVRVGDRGSVRNKIARMWQHDARRAMQGRGANKGLHDDGVDEHRKGSVETKRGGQWAAQLNAILGEGRRARTGCVLHYSCSTNARQGLVLNAILLV
jgi:hypothetical protein